jgi:hypothetical protein
MMLTEILLPGSCSPITSMKTKLAVSPDSEASAESILESLVYQRRAGSGD